MVYKSSGLFFHELQKEEPDERFENIQYVVALVVIVRSPVHIFSVLLCIWARGRTRDRKVSILGCE